jgi:hypothetical protein
MHKIAKAIRKVCIFQGEVGLQNSIFVKFMEGNISKGSLPPKYCYRFISMSGEELWMLHAFKLVTVKWAEIFIFLQLCGEDTH